jgi:hypothetical protein
MQDGIFAFPSGEPATSGSQSGITIRDYFAASALQALIAKPSGAGIPLSKDMVAATAYEWADAMLRAKA